MSKTPRTDEVRNSGAPDAPQPQKQLRVAFLIAEMLERIAIALEKEDGDE